ncbi:ATP-dependent DNA ligase [Nocardia tengchongensis]|uniref:ATP-dependent DNA ligase n=1 Tax=Nocardia tengchongensis TaxID=2055889 RepID=UPI0036A0B6ED
MVHVPAPMLATAGPVPADDDPHYAYEWKYDGIRCLAGISDGMCSMVSRNGNSLNDSFPEIAHALLTLAAGREMTVDGELVAPDAVGVPRFSRIGRRLGVVRPSRSLIRSVPTQMYLFDVLGLDGVDLRPLTYRDRREHLERLPLPHGPILLSPSYRDIPVSRMLDVAAEHEIEGVIGKRLNSAYRAGRSSAWRKLPLRRTTEAVVVGWLGRHGGGEGFGSLLIAAHDHAGDLVLLGAVGTGFTDAARRALHHELEALATATPPVAGVIPSAFAATAHWVSPRLVGDVAYRERTASGLRHPSWRGLRFDRSPAEVTVPEND